jgi:hypothetical protein
METPNNTVLIQLVQDLIGVTGLYQGAPFTLIEVLSEGPMLVLEPSATDLTVQNTAQGEAKRYAQNNYTVPLLSEVKRDLHPVLVEFFGRDISEELRKAISE